MNRHKKQTRKQWNENPCGIRGMDPTIPYGSRGFFQEVRRLRYEVDDQWIPQTIDFKAGKGKTVLEIGYGIGTDLLSWKKAGAEVHGVDITPEHFKLAKKNFQFNRQKADLRLHDAAHLPFKDGSFDLVYSNGVLHHTPDIEQCFLEACRVLKPGGKFIVALYHTYSAFHLFAKVLSEGIFQGQLWKLGYAGLMATLEYGADGIKVKPLVNTYSKHQLRGLLEEFSKVEFQVAHFKREHMGKFRRLVPGFLEKSLEPWLGWYVIAYATK